MEGGTDGNLKEGGEELRYDLIAEMPNCSAYDEDKYALLRRVDPLHWSGN
jgi:hypothetical protein